MPPISLSVPFSQPLQVLHASGWVLKGPSAGYQYNRTYSRSCVFFCSRLLVTKNWMEDSSVASPHAPWGCLPQKTGHDMVPQQLHRQQRMNVLGCQHVIDALAFFCSRSGGVDALPLKRFDPLRPLLPADFLQIVPFSSLTPSRTALVGVDDDVPLRSVRR